MERRWSMDIRNPKLTTDAQELFRITNALHNALGFPEPMSGGKSAIVMFRLLAVLRSARLTELEARCALNAALAILPQCQTGPEAEAPEPPSANG
jgi:hypothetical protein